MISNVQASSMAYVQNNALKDDASKSVAKTDKSEGLDKVSALKAQIENGTYKVDLSKTAKAVAEELL
jgi:anti-sigma28 factor (negative regulator of flagellin synthesis)